jgi:3-methyl-2-oxobutanoate hydroxymethyltransferase
MKERGEKITVLTAYDSFLAGILDEAGIDIILVGDSLGNVVQGRDTTIPVTLRDMIYHGEIVARTVHHAFVTIDMPFMSFRSGLDDAVRNAGIILQKTGCHAVKPEGGVTAAPVIRRIVQAGIPVMGHIGLTPQSINIFGGYGVRGRENRQGIIDDALSVEDAGAFAVVLEKIPASPAEEITGRLSIPTIGIGAGKGCDGQVLVTNDMLGMFDKFKPSFVRRYAALADAARNGIKKYVDDVKKGEFPGIEESYE